MSIPDYIQIISVKGSGLKDIWNTYYLGVAWMKGIKNFDKVFFDISFNCFNTSLRYLSDPYPLESVVFNCVFCADDGQG